MKINIEEILQYLESKKIVSRIVGVNADETAQRGFYKIQCKLIPSNYQLQIKYIITPEDFIYVYQLYIDKPLIRWDNSPHFTEIKTLPHHFHDVNAVVISSSLSGIDVIADIDYVFEKIEAFINDEITQ